MGKSVLGKPPVVQLNWLGRTVRLRFWAKVTGVVFLVGLIGLNAVAIFHAKAMTGFSFSGSRTQKPEDLGLAGKVRVLLTGVNVPRPANSLTPGDVGLAFETHRYPNGHGHTLEAWHIPAGDSDTLVLLFHGYATSKGSLLPIAAEFHALGCDAFLVDFYGSGGSSGNGTSIGFLEAKDVTASLRYARERWPLSKLVLYGMSMGGAAVLRSVATDGIEPDAIVVEGAFDRLLNTVKNRFTAMNLPATPFASLLVFWGGRRVGFDGFEHNPSEYAEAVQCPALVLHGANDQRVTASQARVVYEALGGWKRFSEYPEAGHEPVLSADAARWRADIKLLLERLR